MGSIWNNTDEGVRWRDEEKQTVQRTEALYHTATEPDIGGEALSDSGAHLRVLHTSTHTLSLR